MKTDREHRLERAAIALDGLSVGDAFGEQFFLQPEVAVALIYDREVPMGTLRFTDDTVMALGIMEVLRELGSVDQDRLARVFARRYRDNPLRGYGGTAHEILDAISRGQSWRDVSAAPFGGQGSMGNGGGMRAAPLGAFFACDPDEVIVEQARRSAEVTHHHPDGQAGAIAVALAAAFETRRREHGQPVTETTGKELMAFVGRHVPAGPTAQGLDRARVMLEEGASVIKVAGELGSGFAVLSSDTVPFSIFCAASCLGRYEDAIWTTLEGLGDRDTTCAIVGGIVASGSGADAIPRDWLRRREQLA
jgi:ADP-ribosylglycohydrolase